MKTSDFYYYLPEELIAQHPSEKRDESRLLQLNGSTGQVRDLLFKNIIDIVNPGDCLVLNDTRVMHARLYGTKSGLEHPVEVLLLKRLSDDEWEAIVKPGRRLREGAHIVFKENVLEADIIKVRENGNRVLKFIYTGIWEEILAELGEMPLPPYIHEKLSDDERYQTVYSKHLGSAAAPTAGLHFTKELLKALEDKGVSLAYLTLHVGIGTFRPVKEENIEDHDMHTEEYIIKQEACDLINASRKAGKKVIAVGTTSCRVLESLNLDGDLLVPQSGSTSIYIYPGFKFQVVDDLITNFHLPESTLIMLVSALSTREIILETYKQAVEKQYRFFSFGDAMYIEGNPASYKGFHQGKHYA